MASPGDNINPIDHILSRMSEPPAAEDLPAEMLCPSGHRATRFIYRISTSIEGSGAPPTEVGAIPIWICQACMVGYRYQECALIPGEEGHA